MYTTLFTTTFISLLTTLAAFPTNKSTTSQYQPQYAPESLDHLCTIPHLAITFDDNFANRTTAIPLFATCTDLHNLTPSYTIPASLLNLASPGTARSWAMDFGTLIDSNSRPIRDTDLAILRLTKQFQNDIEVFKLSVSVEVIAENQGEPDVLVARDELVAGRTGVATDAFIPTAQNVLVLGLKITVDTTNATLV
jgi:hypothetical protein